MMLYWKRFKTEAIYLWEDETEQMIRATPGEGYICKTKAVHEFSMEPHNHIVVRAIHTGVEITKGI